MRIATATLTAAALLAALCAAPALHAADAASAATDAREPGAWEEVVFLPQSGLSVLLERDPRGVLLARASYLDLYRRARAARGGASDSLPGPAGVGAVGRDGV